MQTLLTKTITRYLYCVNVQIIGHNQNYIEKTKTVNYTENKYSHRNEGGIKMDSLYPNLSSEMEAHGLSIESLAKIIGRSEKIVRLKLRGVQEWTLSEAVAICRYLQCHDLKKLFLRKLR